MIHILHDTPEGYPFIAKRMTLPCVKHFSPQFKHKYMTWIAGSWRIMRTSKKGDIILTVYDFQGVLCYWIGLMTFRRRKTLGINILLKQKKSIRNKIASFMYKRALKSGWFFTTATTDHYGKWIAKHLNLSNTIPILRDVMYDSYMADANTIGSTDEGYVFSGGRNSRDWNLLINIAKMLPDILFKISAPSKVKESFDSDKDLLKNIEWHCDISYDEFNKLLSRASIVALPLDTEAPAGLIVIFQSAAFNKPLIVSKTISTQDYIPTNCGFILDKDISLWRKAIYTLIQNKALSADMANNLHNYIVGNCNEQKYVATIERLLGNIQKTGSI